MCVALAIAAALGHRSGGESALAARLALDTAREMHLVHALSLILVGAVRTSAERSVLVAWAGWLFLTGILFFCGGIYISFGLAIVQVKQLIPIGGICFIVGWILFTVGALTMTRPNK